MPQPSPHLSESNYSCNRESCTMIVRIMHDDSPLKEWFDTTMNLKKISSENLSFMLLPAFTILI